MPTTIKRQEKGTSETIRLWRNHRTAKYSMHNTDHVIIEASVYNSRDKPVNMEVKKTSFEPNHADKDISSLVVPYNYALSTYYTSSNIYIK